MRTGGKGQKLKLKVDGKRKNYCRLKIGDTGKNEEQTKW